MGNETKYLKGQILTDTITIKVEPEIKALSVELKERHRVDVPSIIRDALKETLLKVKEQIKSAS